MNLQNLVEEEECTDSYGNVTPTKIRNMSGNFLERKYYSTQAQVFNLSKKVIFFYKECVVYPYVNIVESKN